MERSAPHLLVLSSSIHKTFRVIKQMMLFPVVRKIYRLLEFNWFNFPLNKLHSLVRH